MFQAWRQVVERMAAKFVLGKLHVGTGVRGNAERGHHGDVVGRIVDCRQVVDQVAHFLRRVNQAAAVDAVRHACLGEGALQWLQDRPRWHQDGNVAIPGGARSRSAAD